MPAFSKPVAEPQALHVPNPVLQIANRTLSKVARAVANGEDLLSILPAEIRIMIFEELLTGKETVYRGIRNFGLLDPEHFPEVHIAWQILLTCRLYYQEALPIFYSKNEFVFCTGRAASPGLFWRFPIRIRHMGHLTRLGIYFCSDDPRAQSSIRVAHFIKALSRHARMLEYLEVLIGSVHPWKMLFYSHPATDALRQLAQSQTVKELVIRFHGETTVYQPWAQYLEQVFNEHKQLANRSITFALSCSCFPIAPSFPPLHCAICFRAFVSMNGTLPKPMKMFVCSSEVQATQATEMEVQDDLFMLGLLPLEDDDGELEEDDDNRPYNRLDLAQRIAFYGRNDRFAGVRQTVLTEYFQGTSCHYTASTRYSMRLQAEQNAISTKPKYRQTLLRQHDATGPPWLQPVRRRGLVTLNTYSFRQTYLTDYFKLVEYAA